MIKRALISVSNKQGLLPFAKSLVARGVEIVSSGGTSSTIAGAGLPVTKVADVTNAPEILGGRVKTLHPKIHGGILGRPGLASDDADMEAQGITPFGLVVVNLYPFAETLLKGADIKEAIENIDIGGPAMVRASAKNHEHVVIIVDPADYDDVIAGLDENALDLGLRRKLARKAFAHTAQYDSLIARWLGGVTDDAHPEAMSITGNLAQELRYGENPHQKAAFYADPLATSGLPKAQQHQGKELSYNNINDADAAWALVEDLRDLGPHASAIIKHAQPCGAAIGQSPKQAFDKALRSDPVSAFGGIIAMTGVVDEAAASAMAELFAEVVMADGFTKEALDIFAGKKNLRVLTMPRATDLPHAKIKSVSGGFLVQSADMARINNHDLEVKAGTNDDEAALADLVFGFRVVKHVTSNGIVLARDGATVGIGGGQTNRVDAVDLAVRRADKSAQIAGEPTSFAKGARLASDAFFPFPDNIERLAEAGVTHVVQPTGSMRDEQVFAKAAECGVTIYGAPSRHFKH